MDNIQQQKKNFKEKNENMNNKLNNEELKRKTNHIESKFKKFCGCTDLILNLPTIDESLKFLKHEVDNSILNFNYSTMLLNEKVERLNDVERNVSIPMELPFLYSFNLENNDDIRNWINEQNICEKEKDSKLLNNIYLNDKLKEFSSYLPIVKSFEKEDFDLLNVTIPNYFKRIRNNILANEEKKNRENDKNVDNVYNTSIDDINAVNTKKKILYNEYFEHPLKKYLKIKKIYPIIPYISVWRNKYVQGIMEIESNNKINENNKYNQSDYKKKKNKKFYGLLHLIEKSRDKHIYSLYKNHDINNMNYFLKNLQNKSNKEKKEYPDDKKNSLHKENNNILENRDIEKNNKNTMENIKLNENQNENENQNNNNNNNNNNTKKKISLSKFLIKKHILKLKKLEKLKNNIPKEVKKSLTKDNKEEFSSTKKKIFMRQSLQINEGSSLNEKIKYQQTEKNLDEGNEKNEIKIEKSVSLTDMDNSINKNVLDENVKLFKYVRDYKSPPFSLNKNDTMSYVIGLSKKRLAYIFPTLSKKVIFSKTGHQKRKNYILLKE
ncbi:conserved Plasmodium protein, unknown function [Plasmodium gallinaceum]|uniref:Uncharacterized protein n=1 Tax=Plasmodium gallinaceum TaxID=5849 RepID=A0A1J1GVX8_PLAGA|nr:conserved Plasmodium protein, unknown function [Plasmodium gallinaceum]CRG95171.1 conserved Plasmodium protein, unknown function [Plasmodium gallinaceum]